MQETEHYKLKKPAATDFYNVADQSENAEKLDAALYGLETGKEALLKSAAAKETLADTDSFALIDSADSSKTKRLTWSVVKAALKTWLDTLYAVAAHTHAWSTITGKPSSFAPSSHADTHKTGGADPLTASDVGAVPTARKVNGKALTADIALVPTDIGAEVSGAAATVQDNLTAHIGDAVKHITATERTNWNGKAAAVHTHAPTDLTGAVPTSLGGTGLTTLTAGSILTGNGTGEVIPVTPLDAARKLGIGYGGCTTAAATAAKTATITNFAMLTGAIVGIQFNPANTAASPTLNINSLGAKSIINGITNTYITTGDILTGMTAYFQYNGTYWVLLNPATRMVFGTYIGAGAYGSGNPNTLTFNFAPKLVVVQPRSADGIGAGFVWLNGATKATAYSSIGGSGSASYTVTLIWSGTGLSWYSTTDASTQLNFGGNEYAYMALG